MEAIAGRRLIFNAGIDGNYAWQVHSWSLFWAVLVGMFVVIQAAALFLYSDFEMPVQKFLRSVPRRLLSAASLQVAS